MHNTQNERSKKVTFSFEAEKKNVSLRVVKREGIMCHFCTYHTSALTVFITLLFQLASDRVCSDMRLFFLYQEKSKKVLDTRTIKGKYNNLVILRSISSVVRKGNF